MNDSGQNGATSMRSPALRQLSLQGRTAVTTNETLFDFTTPLVGFSDRERDTCTINTAPGWVMSYRREISCSSVSVSPGSMLRFTGVRSPIPSVRHLFRYDVPTCVPHIKHKVGVQTRHTTDASTFASLSVEWLVILTTTHISEPALTLGVGALIVIVTGCSATFCAASGIQPRNSNKQAFFTVLLLCRSYRG